MERRKEEEEERIHRGRQRSLQHDGNKEQMESSSRNKLTFTFFFNFLLSLLPFFSNFVPQEWEYMLTPLPMRTPTRPSVSLPKRSMPPVSRLRKWLALVRRFFFPTLHAWIPIGKRSHFVFVSYKHTFLCDMWTFCGLFEIKIHCFPRL